MKLLPIAAAAGLLLGAPALPTRAQTAPAKAPEVKFGKPEPANFVAKNFVADSAARAVVLYDYGTTRFCLNGLNFQMETERTTRIKILKKAGYDCATAEVPLYHQGASAEKTTDLKLFKHNY